MRDILIKNIHYIMIVYIPDVFLIVSESILKSSPIKNDLLYFDKEIDTIQFILLIMVIIKIIYDINKEFLRTAIQPSTVDSDNKNRKNREILKHKKENIKF